MASIASKFFSVTAILAFGAVALAADDPAAERSETMKGVREEAKTLGAMLKGEKEFSNEDVMKSLEVWAAAGDKFGGLFPEGSEGGEAAPAIWSDREGFDAALAKWRDATAAAIAANPATLDDAKPLLGAAFNGCKNCHDNYRIEKD